jgi:hypothetical protein
MSWRRGSTTTTMEGSIAVPQSALKKAISQSFGANPVLHCNKNNEIMEIWMCLDLELHAIECPDTVGKEEQCRSITIADNISSSSSSKIIIPGGQAVSLACKRFFPPTLNNWWFFNTSIQLVLSFLAGFGCMTIYWKCRRCIPDEDGDLYERLYHV